MKTYKTTCSTPCRHFSLYLGIHTPHCHHSVLFLISHMNLWNSSLPCPVEEEILLEIFEIEVTLEPKHWRNFCFAQHSLSWILICDSLLHSLGAKKKYVSKTNEMSSQNSGHLTEKYKLCPWSHLTRQPVNVNIVHRTLPNSKLQSP